MPNVRRIIKQFLKEDLNWGTKDAQNWDKDARFSTDAGFGTDPYWGTDPEKSYWKKSEEGGGSTSSGAGASGGETVTEEDNILDDSNPFNWIDKETVAPNYEGFPQGVVYLRDHDEIDYFKELIKKINPEDFDGRGKDGYHLHQALEGRRDELEFEDYDPSDAVISVSFFVEKNYPGGLSIGYWSWEVDDEAIMAWLNEEDETFNKDYELYTSLNKLEKVLNYY